ncbi:alpha/beta-type small acid-soluble spore protein [Paenibacillus humicola]|uniref:alpha/beta-type small acid-soluble spore protein n=1 Tax=Paenibacillus humicola TaxID=3110540 RepID=UPI00237AF715|nr:alpha/beta-type small acid-soluble spore protein [Paenibacillus humicola]
MARRGRRRLLVPEAQARMDAFKADVMRREGYSADPNRPDEVKYEVARSLGVPLQPGGGNGQLTTESVGHVGGKIGGSMVRELVRMAQQKLADERKRP